MSRLAERLSTTGLVEIHVLGQLQGVAYVYCKTWASDGNGGSVVTVAGAQPIIGNDYLVLDVRGNNDIGRGIGDFVVFGSDNVPPNAYQEPTATAVASNGNLLRHFPQLSSVGIL